MNLTDKRKQLMKRYLMSRSQIKMLKQQIDELKLRLSQVTMVNDGQSETISNLIKDRRMMKAQLIEKDYRIQTIVSQMEWKIKELQK